MKLPAIALIVSLALTTAAAAQDNVPLTEPTNRPLPPRLKTSGIYSFCAHDQSLAFVPDDNRTRVHQLFAEKQTSLQPLQLGGEVTQLALSPDGQSLAAIVDKGVVIVTDRTAEDAREVELPESFVIGDSSMLKWSADSGNVFVLNSGSPASALRVGTDQPDQAVAISFENGRHFFASPAGDLLVAFWTDGAEIWRRGSDRNKMVSGRSSKIVGSADGRFLAFMADDALQIWTLAPLGKGGSVAAYGADFVEFSADGSRLLVFEVDDKAKCYEVGDKGQLTLSQEYEATNGCGWVSDDGKLGACFSYSETSRLMRVFRCDRKAETEIPIVTKSPGLGGYDPDIFPEEFQLSSDGRRGLVVWPAGRIEMFDIAGGLSDWGCRVPDLAEVWLTSTGDRILTIDEGGNLQLHDTSLGRIDRKIVDVERHSPVDKRYGDTRFRFQVLPDGEHCVIWCGPKRRQFTVIEIDTGKIVGRAEDSREDGEYIKGWYASPDGSLISVIGERVRLLKTGFRSEETPSDAIGRFHMAFEEGGLDEPVHGIYSTKSGELRRTLKWEFIDGSAFDRWGHVSRDGKLCALVGRRLDGNGNGVEVRSTITGKQLFAVPFSASEFAWLDFTRDQQGIWVVTRQALMRLDFESKTLKPVFTDSEKDGGIIEAHPKRPTPLPDSQWHTTQFQCFAESDTGWIATGHRRGFVNVWSTKDNKRYALLRCGTERVEALAFSDDGRHLLSWCADRDRLQITDLSSILPATPPAAVEDSEDDLDLDF